MIVGDFVPSPMGLTISWTAAIGVGALMGGWTYIDPFYAHDTPERASRLAKSPGMANPLARMLFIGIFSGVMTFVATNGAVLEFWTLAVGRPSEQVMHLGAYHGSSRYNCAGFDIEEARWQLRRALCIHYRYDETPAIGTPVVVHGPASAVGIEIERFDIRPDEQPT
jgi:hypothetical protein